MTLADIVSDLSYDDLINVIESYKYFDKHGELGITAPLRKITEQHYGDSSVTKMQRVAFQALLEYYERNER